MASFLQTNLKFYNRHNRLAPIVFFFGGFTWDNLTLTRIDRISDNIILLTYILLLGALIILINLVEKGEIRKPLILKYREWYPLGIQFFMGGFFSSYIVFYFQSASLTKTSLFVGILVLLLLANEFLNKRLMNLYFIAALYFLATFSFFIFFIPVVTKVINVYTFMAGGLLSLLIVTGTLFFLYKKSVFPTRNVFIFTIAPVGILFTLLNFFYAQNWIPPVPLSLKSGGIYHHISKNSDSYSLKFEQSKRHQFWKKSDDPFRYAAGDTVFCFTAIFAPTKLKKNIYDHWQRYLPERKARMDTDLLKFDVTGGRDGGYRGYTYKINVSPGKWRVDVQTEEELILGRIDFEIENTEVRVPLRTIYK